VQTVGFEQQQATHRHRTPAGQPHATRHACEGREHTQRATQTHGTEHSTDGIPHLTHPPPCMIAKHTLAPIHTHPLEPRPHLATLHDESIHAPNMRNQPRDVQLCGHSLAASASCARACARPMPSSREGVAVVRVDLALGCERAARERRTQLGRLLSDCRRDGRLACACTTEPASERERCVRAGRAHRARTCCSTVPCTRSHGSRPRARAPECTGCGPRR
jgi:hypothetical protein